MSDPEPTSPAPRPSLMEWLKPMIGGAVARQAELRGHARYEWEISPFVMPQPDGSTAACAFLLVWIPSPIVGQWLSYTMVIGDPHMTQAEAAENMARSVFEGLAGLASRVLAAGNGAPGPPPPGLAGPRG